MSDSDLKQSIQEQRELLASLLGIAILEANSRINHLRRT